MTLVFEFPKPENALAFVLRAVQRWDISTFRQDRRVWVVAAKARDEANLIVLAEWIGGRQVPSPSLPDP